MAYHNEPTHVDETGTCYWILFSQDKVFSQDVPTKIKT